METELLAENARQIHGLAQSIQRQIGPFQARATVLAGIAFAFVNVELTVLAAKTVVALAGIVIHLVDALGTVHALVGGTLVNVHFAEASLVARRTAVAVESAQLIDAHAVVLARSRHTIVNVDLTETPRHARNAGAGEIVDQVEAC